MMERNLSRAEQNNSVLVVGEAGSGRRSMIQALAERSFLGESLPEINYKRVVQLDLTSLLARFDNQEEASRILDLVFKETLSAGNIILVIDDLHNFVGTQAARPGVMDISGVLAPYLPYPQFQIVAVTTFEGLHKNLETNQSILSMFEKVEVSEVSEKETLMILENMALSLESKYKKFVSYRALRDIISYCAKYMPAIPFPEKAMNLLEEAVVHLTQARKKVLLSEHIAKLVSEKTQIPVGDMEEKEKDVLLNLEDLIHQRIINQEQAVNEISSALRRARTAVTVRQGPMGAFLFLGPTGVGKTETSKALAEIYFGSEDRMIRLDMSEFQAVSDIPRMLGSAGEEGLLTTKVRENPFSLILLDEIEKAHPNILNLFLQVLDEGYVTDGLGRKTDFKNTIIIATSNAGYQVILEALKQNKPTEEIKEELLDFLFREGLFRPEFLNRFDGVVVFKSLSKENLLDISELLLQKMKKNLALKEIEFIITPELKEKIVELSYDPKFGAREMRRVIQDKVENVLALAILSGKLKRGYVVKIEPEGFKLVING
jgi:ATP-dependent Clp protease ATP-binding subunit ClpC